MSASFFHVHDDSKILEQIRRGDDEALLVLYNNNRKMIISFITRNSGTADDAEDLLQEAVIVLWEKVRSGKFEYTAKISTFLFAVVKRMWFRTLSRRKKEFHEDSFKNERESGELSPLDILVESEQAFTIASSLEKLGEPCKTLLLLYYWEEKSMEEIAAAMHFANADTVKSKKYQCKKSLEKILSNDQHLSA
ncbi:MAG: sigma-70 family RNA polymerase sigma factor [Bacteroidetes bacterium]|nr:sigma-70 family RNA polymerase sigma factor [Bacteroidota bacterium]